MGEGGRGLEEGPRKKLVLELCLYGVGYSRGRERERDIQLGELCCVGGDLDLQSDSVHRIVGIAVRDSLRLLLHLLRPDLCPLCSYGIAMSY